MGSRRRATSTLSKWVVLGCALVLVSSGCDWTQFRQGPGHTGATVDPTISAANVGSLTLKWKGDVRSGAFADTNSSPAIANGVAYIGDDAGNLDAFDDAGVTNCAGTPVVCEPLWTGPTGAEIISSPAVVNGVAYVGSADGKLYAFDAGGVTNCSGTPKTCEPLWTATTGSSIDSSPAVIDGVVYIGSEDAHLYAFDAGGVTNCSGTPKMCSPLWTASTGAIKDASPAVVGGVVYITSTTGLSAFDAHGVTNCSGTPTTCSPLWTSPNGSAEESPTVTGGVVYALDYDGVAAIDAAGAAGCSGTPKVCSPLWKAAVPPPIISANSASPAVANGMLYVGSRVGTLYAFDALGVTNCSGTPKLCQPLFTGQANFSIDAGAAVAGGVVFAHGDGIEAFDAAGAVNCSGTPKACTRLWHGDTTDSDGQTLVSAPAVANGKVYMGSGNYLWVFGR